jgi:hypothetical protein
VHHPRVAGPPISAPFRASVVIGLGLLLALAATLGPAPSPGGEPGASLAVRLPDAVRTLAAVLLGLAALLLLAVQRRPRPTEEDVPNPRAPRRSPAWTLTLLLVPLLLLWYLIWHYWSSEDVHPIETAFTAIAELLDLLAQARKPATSVPFFDMTLAVLVLLLAFGALALMVLVALADRIETWWARRHRPAPAPARPASRDDDLGDPRAESDPRRAIICAWRHLERALAGVRAPRAPWQTPTEFMRATLARLPVPGPPVARLTALFEIARFSEQPLGGPARDTACACLDEITAALAEDAARER